jgi:hypothetical protein
MSDTQVVTYEIPLFGSPQRFFITLGVIQYQLVFLYREAAMGGWVMDINDDLGNPMACGIPLVTGADLLAQYEYLKFSGALYVVSAGDPSLVPSFPGLGSSSRLMWVPK